MTTQERNPLACFYDELQVGDVFVTGGRTVTETDVVLFSGLSGDNAALHMDDVAAKAGPFGARVAHGALTLALSTGLEYALMSGESETIVAFAGLDRVRFVKPVFIGDTLRVHGSVVLLEDRDETRGMVTFRQEIRNQHGVTVAAFDKRLLYRKRPTISTRGGREG